MLYFHFNISSKIWQRNIPDAFFPALYRCVRPQNRQINGLLGGKLNLPYHYLYIHIHLYVCGAENCGQIDAIEAAISIRNNARRSVVK